MQQRRAEEDRPDAEPHEELPEAPGRESVDVIDDLVAVNDEERPAARPVARTAARTAARVSRPTYHITHVSLPPIRVTNSNY